MNKTGRKIWYGIAIFLCALVLLLSVAGIAVTWVAQRAVTTSITNLIDNLYLVTENIQSTVQVFDQKLANMQAITQAISQASTTLSQQVADQGLITTLLPEEQNKNLSDLSATVQDSIKNIHDTLTTVREIYQTIDQLPFINLPGLNQDQIDKLQQSVESIQTTVDQVTAAITAFRAGASEQIGKVTSAIDQLGSILGDVRSRLADLDTRLANVQTRLAQLRETVATALILASVFGSLFLAFVAYTQVEVIRLYVQRWKLIPAKIGTSTATEQPAMMPGETSSGEGSEPLDDQEKKG